MKIQFPKPALPVPDQIARMAGRGMVIEDAANAAAALARIGYFRLSAYALPWRQPDTEAYKPGITFGTILELYEFDRSLRDLVWEAIEPVEIALRTRTTLHLGLTHGPFAHTNSSLFWHGWDHAEWLAKLDKQAWRSLPHEQFIRHYDLAYTGFPTLPLWMATEVMSFGSLSNLFENLTECPSLR